MLEKLCSPRWRRFVICANTIKTQGTGYKPAPACGQPMKKRRKPTFSCNNVRILNHGFLIAFAILIKNNKNLEKEKTNCKNEN